MKPCINFTALGLLVVYILPGVQICTTLISIVHGPKVCTVILRLCYACKTQTPSNGCQRQILCPLTMKVNRRLYT